VHLNQNAGDVSVTYYQVFIYSNLPVQVCLMLPIRRLLSRESSRAVASYILD